MEKEECGELRLRNMTFEDGCYCYFRYNEASLTISVIAAEYRISKNGLLLLLVIKVLSAMDCSYANDECVAKARLSQYIYIYIYNAAAC